jgi:hypothetical protein
MRRDFGIVSQDIAILTGADTVALPERAAGRGIRQIWFTDVASPAISDFKELKYIDLSDILKLSSLTGNTYAYYFEDDDLKVFPAVPGDSTVRLFYFSRPGNLVEESRTCTVSAIGTDTLTVDATPSNIVLGSKIDVTKVTAGYKTIVKDLVLTARAANSVTVAGYDFSTKSIAVGDIVSLARETSVVQLPEDAHEVLVWSTANEMAASIGILDIIKTTQDQVEANVRGMRDIMSPRTEDVQSVINPNSILRSGNKKFASLLR